MPEAPLILIVEDDPELRLLLATVAEQDGYRVAEADERASGAEILRANHPDLLIANIALRGGDGDDLAKLASALDIPVLLISGEPVAIERHRGRARPFLQKPFRLSELEQKIEELLGKISKD